MVDEAAVRFLLSELCQAIEATDRMDVERLLECGGFVVVERGEGVNIWRHDASRRMIYLNPLEREVPAPVMGHVCREVRAAATFDGVSL
jgi:hypothetical protein